MTDVKIEWGSEEYYKNQAINTAKRINNIIENASNINQQMPSIHDFSSTKLRCWRFDEVEWRVCEDRDIGKMSLFCHAIDASFSFYFDYHDFVNAAMAILSGLSISEAKAFVERANKCLEEKESNENL